MKQGGTMSSNLELNFMGVTSGHNVLNYTSRTPEQKESLKDLVERLLQQGMAIFLIVDKSENETRQVNAYDPENNEWLVVPLTRKRKLDRVSANEVGEVLLVPAQAGG